MRESGERGRERMREVKHRVKENEIERDRL
jgi:hypothetical protein